jgi:hypothetical protein
VESFKLTQVLAMTNASLAVIGKHINHRKRIKNFMMVMDFGEMPAHGIGGQKAIRRRRSNN